MHAVTTENAITTSTEQETRMLPHIAQAAKTVREDHGLLPVDIAAALRSDPVRIKRFEAGRAWPTHPDDMIGAYARATGTPATDIWTAAVALMQAASAQEPKQTAAREVQGIAEQAARQRRERRSRGAASRPDRDEKGGSL